MNRNDDILSQIEKSGVNKTCSCTWRADMADSKATSRKKSYRQSWAVPDILPTQGQKLKAHAQKCISDHTQPRQGYRYLRGRDEYTLLKETLVSNSVTQVLNSGNMESSGNPVFSRVRECGVISPLCTCTVENDTDSAPRHKLLHTPLSQMFLAITCKMHSRMTHLCAKWLLSVFTWRKKMQLTANKSRSITTPKKDKIFNLFF